MVFIIMAKDIEIRNIENAYNNTFEILEEHFINLKQRVKYRCTKCGYVGEQTLAYLKYNGHCKKCKKEENIKKCSEKNYKLRYNRCKEMCNKRNYKFYGIFKKNSGWYVKFDMNICDRNGKPYGIIEQEEYSFLRNSYPKILSSNKIAKPQEEYISKAQIIHPELDFSNTVYINNKTSIKVVCPKHGEFSVSPKEVIKSEYKCSKCKKEEILKEKQKNIVNEMSLIHNGKYTYDAETFNGINKKMKIFCPEHGEFWQAPKYHLNGSCCPRCSQIKRGLENRLTDDEFKERVKKIHGEKYDLSMCEYKRSDIDVAIICHEKDKYGIEHGIFYVSPHSFLSGQNCPKCVGKHQMNLDEFKETANIVHHNKYDYSLITEYNGTYTKVPICCHQKDDFGREHGVFWQTPKHHLNGFGCKKCSSNYMDLDLFIKRSNNVHRGKYIYDNIKEYKSNNLKVPIICPEHGEFWQTPMCHLSGQGCPYCKESHLERKVNNMLKDNNIEFERQKRFNWLINDKTKYTLPLDFYLPDYNIAIECQGEQHFKPVNFGGNTEEEAFQQFRIIQDRDKKKKELCKSNNVKLLYYSDIKYEENIFTKLKEILKYIKLCSV